MLYICCMTDLQNFSIILRYLRILEIGESFFEQVIFDKIAINGTKADLLNALDAPFENEGRELSFEAQNCLSAGIDEDGQLENIITTAINNENAEIIEYLLTYWTHLLQQLPLKHQIFASTTAFRKKQLDVLCDLLEIADFPFPKKLRPEMVSHKRLKKIVNERAEFTAAIKDENFKKIGEFINNNSSIKFLYNPDNNSALKQALDMKKFGVFYYLKSLGFKGEDCAKILDELDQEERKQAMQQALQQRKMNVSKALPYVHKSVFLLSTRSRIHNKRISKEQEAEYGNKIRKWLEDIYKIAPVLIDVAASCEYLKIIFDFESKSVENVALKATTVLGTTYPTSKWIFIGAILSDAKREQEIKGILAHELCHYVMRLVYNNNEHPYYKYETKLKQEFEAIAQKMNKWPTKEAKEDDECNEIISGVFCYYGPENFHPELIVRVVHILVEFDNDDEKIKYLNEKYMILFDYWKNHVIPEMQNFLEKNQATIRLNGTIGLLSKISRQKIEFSTTKDIKKLTESKQTVVTTNVPKLLLINIHKYVRKNFKDLYDTKNLFIDPKELCKLQIYQDFNEVCEQNGDLNIFVDCTKDMTETISSVLVSNGPRFIFLVSNENQRNELIRILNENELRIITEMEINYNWCDLSAESQKFLLKTKINFQNNSEIPLVDLFRKEVNQEEQNGRTTEKVEILKDFSEIIDSQTLNLLMEKSQIVINSEDNLVESSFRLLYQKRKMKKTKNSNIDNGDQSSEYDYLRHSWKKSEKNPKISQEEFLKEVKKRVYVLLSDMAGNGKSWAMKYFANTLRKKNPTKWVVYVDLKQHIEFFRTEEVDFLNFIIQKVLKLQTNFEEGIFKKLYEKGKIAVFFDGFDEIAPDCAQFVSKLAYMFDFNEGNQLWIATRDYFQVDLQEKLQIDDVYKLNEFTEDDGINFIVRSWMLNDLKNSGSTISKDDFEKYVKDSPNIEKYEEMASNIVVKVTMQYSRIFKTVGLPQIYKMIADVSKDDKESTLKLKESQIYKKFIEKIYNRWLHKKGPLRKEANTKSLDKKLNFKQFHEFHAIKSMFPEYAKLFFPGCNGNEWPVEEVIAFGLMSKNNEGYYFLHETFREYFVADLIAQKMLEQNEPEDNIIELFVKILTVKKYRIIRKFLNNAIEDYSTFQKFEGKLRPFHEEFYKMTSFDEIFEHNLEHFMKFVITVLKTFLTSVPNHNRQIKNIVTNKNIDGLKEFIEIQEVFHNIIGSSLKIEVFEEFVIKIEEKCGREFIKEILLTDKHSLRERGSIFAYLSRCSNLNSHKMKKFLEIMKKYVSTTDMFELMKNYRNGSILATCIKSRNTQNFEILWKEIKSFFEAENLSEKFLELVKQKVSNGKTILYYVPFVSDNVQFHEIFWNLLFEMFENEEELKNFILENCEFGDNFIHRLVSMNKNPNIISKTLDIFQKKFTPDQFKEIVKSRDQNEHNLLHSATYLRHDNVFETVLEFLRSYYHSNEEFFELVKEVDGYGKNVLLHAACFSPKKVFELVMKELEKFASPNEIKKLLRSLTVRDENLLQIAVKSNANLDPHEYLWDILKEYFESKEILEFIRHVDKKGDNLLRVAVDGFTSKEVLELTWNKIKSFMTHDEQIEYLKTTGSRGENLIRELTQGDLYKKKMEFSRKIKKEYRIEL